MKRVFIYRNGVTAGGKVIVLPETFDDLLIILSVKFGVTIKKLYMYGGEEVEDLECIRNDDKLIACGIDEEFMAPRASTPEDENECLCHTHSSAHDWISLNVGGRIFATTRCTLVAKEPRSMLARMFDLSNGTYTWPTNAVDDNGAYLIDRSPGYFEPILNYLRHGQLIMDKGVHPLGVLEEARFFGIETLVPVLESLIQEEPSEISLTRSDVIKALICTSCLSELRFQGVDLAGANLSRLDLRNINFKYANLSTCQLIGANISSCCLERADLSNANLECAVMSNVQMLCANLEGANLKSCNMEDPSGGKANLEGANLKGANLEGSLMCGVNLRVATLKNANLKNCDLRGAALAGANLENCNLSGSDLHEANLRGANLENTLFELMLTPLHMAQAIR